MYSQEQEKYYFDQAKQFLANDVPEDEAAYELLKKVIKYADWKYYVQSNPLLADVEYDILFKQLHRFEQAHPQCIKNDSPRILRDWIQKPAKIATLLIFSTNFGMCYDSVADCRWNY